ncbi:MAG: diaminopimelate dehydrogenase [Ruminococcaceae bacterium]|nr:diaminopimelate dehydrogenase [Oscillospiraceae bacterium]
MKNKIKVAVYGYGNIGRGVEAAITKCPDMELVAIFTRRDPSSVRPHGKSVPVFRAQDILSFKDRIDVVILCGGSATDLPVQTPDLARDFCVVDSFDNHANIPEHFANVDKAAKKGRRTAIISSGWDPGLFSLMRLYSESALPSGESYTFWGKGVSQGHSDAIRRIDGVKDARQYTVPIPAALDAVRSGEMPELSAREKHERVCYVVAEQGADLARIEREIKEMPNYFAPYETTVHFISEEELKRDHSKLPHGGSVIRSGKSGFDNENTHVVEFSLKLDSNPEFTSGMLVASARAVCRMNEEEMYGCKTLFDVPPAYFHPMAPSELRAKLL